MNATLGQRTATRPENWPDLWRPAFFQADTPLESESWTKYQRARGRFLRAGSQRFAAVRLVINTATHQCHRGHHSQREGRVERVEELECFDRWKKEPSACRFPALSFVIFQTLHRVFRLRFLKRNAAKTSSVFQQRYPNNNIR